MTDPQIPSPDDILARALAVLKELRPQAYKFYNNETGFWSNVIAGLKAQPKLELARLAAAAKAGRLSLSSGTDLRELVASEYELLQALDPTKAIGEITIARTGEFFPSGSIPRGTKFRRAAVTVAPVLGDATFESTVDVFVPSGVTSVTIPLVATREGTFANTPQSGATIRGELQDTLFDPAWAPYLFSSAGGSDGATDDDIRRYAKAYFQGQWAPTDAALYAGCFNAGARHVGLFDLGLGTTELWVADDSWASGTTWAANTLQSLYDNGWAGFGTSVNTNVVTNKLINITANVVVTDPNVLFDTTELEQQMRVALRAYFDDRPDWWMWKSAALRGILSQVDRKKVIGCLSVVVEDSDGVVMTEPLETDATPYHYMMADNPLIVTYTLPT